MTVRLGSECEPPLLGCVESSKSAAHTTKRASEALRSMSAWSASATLVLLAVNVGSPPSVSFAPQQMITSVTRRPVFSGNTVAVKSDIAPYRADILNLWLG